MEWKEWRELKLWLGYIENKNKKNNGTRLGNNIKDKVKV